MTDKVPASRTDAETCFCVPAAHENIDTCFCGYVRPGFKVGEYAGIHRFKTLKARAIRDPIGHE